MTITLQNPTDCNLMINCEDRFYPARNVDVIDGQARMDATAALRLTAALPVSRAAANQPYSWWAQSYHQGLPAIGGRYQFLRGAWLPQIADAGWDASASWGGCAPSTGEAC